MSKNLRDRLKISNKRFKEINDFLLNPRNEQVKQILALVEKFGGPEEINRKADRARDLDSLLSRLKRSKSPYYDDVMWLKEQRDKKAFIGMKDYRKKILGKNSKKKINIRNAVTLEISALQYFPFIIAQAKRAIKNQELMPGRFIRVRNMKEQIADNADILAVAVAMQIVGASYVETIDTKGTDGSNCHLGGPETITGYFGGVGQPNKHAIMWAEEYLKYYTRYGIRQVLNINAGTIMVAYIMHRLGIDNEFKISVYLGNDNPFSVMWTLLAAKLFAREDGTTSLIGFNFANSVDNDTIIQASALRKMLGLEKVVRFEHHITETYKSIVVQPYNRRDELVKLAAKVPNISAKHEGADPEIDSKRKHPSDILEYFLTKDDIEKQGLMGDLQRNYLDKHDALNRTADALTKAGIGVVAAGNLH